MGLSCDYDSGGDFAWYYDTPSTKDFTQLSTKRHRNCCSCGAKINVGDDSLKFERHRYPTCDIEERIYGDDASVPLASWYLCEICGGLFMAIQELNLCYSLGNDIREDIREWRAAVKWLRRMAAHGNGIALIPARTETTMFYETVWGVADGVLFLKGRPHFHYVDGRRAAFNSGAPIALIAYGKNNLNVLSNSDLGAVVVMR